MASPFFPALLENLPAKIEFKKIADSFNIGDINVKTIVNNHPGNAIGLRFTEDKKSFVFMTDNELFANAKKTSFKKFVKFVKGADYLTHDAQYTEKIYKPRWGHSTFSQVMQLAKESGVKNVIFTHHDPGSSDKFIDEIVANLQKEFPNYNIEGAVDGKTVHLN
jgi:ribonuclease BN (tRNA processing enzyme)